MKLFLRRAGIKQVKNADAYASQIETEDLGVKLVSKG